MRLDDERVIPDLMNQALTRENITVYDNGKQTRGFCYVSDMIDGLVTLLHSGVDEPVSAILMSAASSISLKWFVR